MASGNSSNANRYKGKDIDTDGDGSVNDSQTLQGNQPSDLGNTIDNSSITENSNGNIQVALPSKFVIGDFENNNAWTGQTRTDDGGNVSSISRFSGDFAIYFDEDKAGNETDALTIDLTNFSEISGAFFVSDSFGTNRFEIRVDGTEVVGSDVSGGSAVLSGDVSGFTGTHNITLFSEKASVSPSTMADNIFLKKNPNRVVSSNAGN